MKPVAFLLMALLLAAGCTGRADPAPGPDPVPALAAVRFLSPQTGWAGGTGIILATTDGGRTWNRQYTGPAAVTALEFVNARHGWAVAGDTLLHTTDGGRTWAPVGSPPPGLAAVDFVDAAAGWGVAAGALYQTGDGGRSWRPVPLPGPVQSVCFAGPAAGWAAGGAAVWRTADGGRTWAPSFQAPVQDGAAWQATVRCGGTGAWLLVEGGGMMSQQAYVVFRTADGQHWEDMLKGGYFEAMYPSVTATAAIDAYAGPVDALDAGTAFFLGRCPACDPDRSVSITTSPDGGRTWARHAIPALAGDALSFPDPQQGWLAGARDGQGLILHTGDGGRTWDIQYPPAPVQAGGGR